MNGTSATLSRRRALAAGLCVAAPLRWGRAGQGGMALCEIAPGLYFRRGLDSDAAAQNDNAIANIGFVVGKSCVAVIDPGGSLTDGTRLRAAVTAVTTLPIGYVIFTHGHPDHIFGAGAFVADRPVFVGHHRLPEALARRGAYYQKGLDAILGAGRAGPVIPPTRLVADRTALDLGDRTILLTAHGLAHTDSDLSILDPVSATLIAGDLLFVGRVPALDGGLRSWLKELATLKALDAHSVVPGHGPVKLRWPEAAGDEQRYLETVLRETRQAVAKGIGIDAAVMTVGRSEREKWTLFDAYHGRNVTEAYRELEWE